MLLEQKEFESVFKAVSNTPAGLKLISHYISFCKCDYFGSISDDPRRDAFLKGKAYVGGDMLSTLKAINLNAYIKTLRTEEKEIKRQKLVNERQDEDE